MKLKPDNIFLLITLIIIFLFYFHTIGYSWKNFDENIIYEETILPIPRSFSEIFEIISSFGINNHFEASNPFYSNISNLRGTPVDVIFCLFVFWLFKKSAILYHIFSLFLHLANSLFCFLIFNNISQKHFNNKNYSNIIRLIVVTLLTLFWALHPVNVESVLFVTNVGALVTYFFCLLIFYYYQNNLKFPSLFHSFIIFFLYLIPLLLNEYSVTLPFVIGAYLICNYLHEGKNVKDTILTISKQLIPLFFALVIFAIYYFLLPSLKIQKDFNLPVILERIFWFSPQVFFHHIKLILFPANLSIDQGAMVRFSHSLFEPYALSCIFFLFVIFAISTIFFLKPKNKFLYCFFTLFVSCIISFLPFLHVISPIYNIASERYSYFPLFFLTLGILNFFIFFSFSNKTKSQIFTVIITAAIVFSYSIRGYTRTFDWKDNFSLLKSAIEVAPNDLYKSVRLLMIYTSSKSLKENKNYLYKSITYLKKAKVYFKEESKKHQNTTPEIIKLYGLDPKTLLAKTMYLRAVCEMELKYDPIKGYQILSPYIKDINSLDSQILSFYYKILFSTNQIAEAENILLKSLNQNKISPTLLVALSDLAEYKYKDLKLTKQYLNQSFKYFPYDTFTLFGLKRLYYMLNNADRYAYFSYLYGFRTHDISSLADSVKVYISLNKKSEAKKVLNKLSRDYPNSRD